MQLRWPQVKFFVALSFILLSPDRIMIQLKEITHFFRSVRAKQKQNINFQKSKTFIVKLAHFSPKWVFWTSSFHTRFFSFAIMLKLSCHFALFQLEFTQSKMDRCWVFFVLWSFAKIFLLHSLKDLNGYYVSICMIWALVQEFSWCVNFRKNVFEFLIIEMERNFHQRLQSKISCHYCGKVWCRMKSWA